MKRIARKGPSRNLAALALFAAALAGGGEVRGENAAPPQKISGNERLSDLLREEPGGEAASPPSMAAPLLRLLGWTAAAVGGGVALVLIARRFAPSGRLGRGSGGIHVVGRTALSPRHAIYLVRVASQRMLILGVSGDRMSTLCEISDPAGIIALDGEFRSSLDRHAGSLETEGNGTAGAGGGEEEGRLPPSSADLAPYRRELDRVRGLVRGWRAILSRRAGGSLAEEERSEIGR